MPKKRDTFEVGIRPKGQNLSRWVAISGAVILLVCLSLLVFLCQLRGQNARGLGSVLLVALGFAGVPSLVTSFGLTKYMDVASPSHHLRLWAVAGILVGFLVAIPAGALDFRVIPWLVVISFSCAIGVLTAKAQLFLVSKWTPQAPEAS